MPIFVSRFSAARISGSRFDRIRDPRDTERADRNDRSQATGQSERTGDTGRTERADRAQDQLPVATQTADSLREQIRNRTSEFTDDSGASAPDRQDAAREALPTQATLPGVRTVSSRTSTSAAASQVGRLGQNTESPAIRATLNRFESLRSARTPTTGDTRSAEVRQAFRDISSEAQNFAGLQARQLNAQVDASIRLLRNRSAEPAQLDLPTVAADREASTLAPIQPTAEQISRANTSPEIQQNLREDSSEIQRGLRVDAEIQSQQNVRQSAANAERAAEGSRNSQLASNDKAVRDLTIQERQFERGLRNTQREIRSLNNENNRLESSAANARASTASNLANRTTLIT